MHQPQSALAAVISPVSQLAHVLHHYNENSEFDSQNDYSLERIEEILAANPPPPFTEEDFAHSWLQNFEIQSTKSATISRRFLPTNEAFPSIGIGVGIHSERDQQTAGLDTGKPVEMEMGIRLEYLTANQFPRADLPTKPGPHTRRISIEDGDGVFEDDAGQDEHSQHTFSQLSAKPTGAAVPSSTPRSQIQALGIATPIECIAKSKPLLRKLRQIVLQEIQNETEEDLIDKGDTIQQKIKRFYLHYTVPPVGGARPNYIANFNVIIGILKEEWYDETKAKEIVDIGDGLYAGLGWQLRAAVLTTIESLPSGRPKKSTKTARGTKRKKLHSEQIGRAPSLAPSLQSNTTQTPGIPRKCYVKDCTRKKRITGSVQQRKHYLTHFPTHAVLCPFIDVNGTQCFEVFESEHYRSNLPKHLHQEHNIDSSALKSSKFWADYLEADHLIQITDRYHTTCLFCPDELSNSKASQNHILKHQNSEPVESLNQA
ncbi:hypothetical protein BKA65DRAFT_569364 [Rhexocercosporidium sp. MPI-PUGE-AT-0058]|nr:hypothetical protein BKA65DRAFT_569364 [Rhexocercosporidium sp. MPI-PUGE-AT-0058]